MPRARNIKPAFFRNEDLVELDFSVRLLFIGLWTLADREGRMEDRPKRIKMELFPADDVNVDDALGELHESGLITRYSASGKNYIEIPKFSKHQHPHHKEPASEIPAPKRDSEEEEAQADEGFIGDDSGSELGDTEGETEADPGQALDQPHADPADSGFLNPDCSSPKSDADKPRRFVAAHIDLPDEVNPEAWREWCEFRTSKRKPVSETAARKQLKMLCRYPKPEQQQIVDHSITNDYQGLFEPKGNNHGSKPTQPSGSRNLSAVERVKAKRRAAEAAMGAVGPDDRDVRPSVDIEHGGRAERYVGSGSS